MFEAYKVGVTLSLQNQVSGVLGFIARDFIKVDKEAKKLQGTLNEIKLLGMSGAILGGVGFMGLAAIKGAVKPASEYVHQLELAKVAHIDTAKAAQAAWQITSTVITTTAAANVAAIKELRMVFGDTGSAAQEAIANVATVQKLQAVLQNVRGGNAHEDAYTVAKALEIKGYVKDPAQFVGAADLMTKAIIASGGKVTPQDFQAAFITGRAATIGWNDRFTFGILPTLIQELKQGGGSGGARGPGNALMSAYAAVVGGAVPQKSLKVWEKIGMLDPSKIVWDKVGSAKGIGPGGILGSGVFQQDPYQWTQQYLVPALVKAGYDTEEKQRQALQYLFPNRTAGFIMSQMALQGWKFDRDQKLIGQASGLSAYDELIKHDPKMAYAALGAQWENLKTALGIGLVPILIPFLRNLTSAFNALAAFAERHPTVTQGLMVTFTALSSLALVGGSLLIASAGLKLVGVALATVSALPLTMMGTAMGGIATGLAALVAPLTVLYGLFHHQEIANWIDKHAPGIGDMLLSAQTLPFGSNRNYVPPSAGKKPIQVNTQVNLDGRQIANVVSDHQYYNMNKDLSSGSGFDGRLSFASPGVP